MTQILRELRGSKIAYLTISEALNFDFGRFLQFLFGQKSEFFASQILREINIGESRSSKTAIFCYYKASEFC